MGEALAVFIVLSFIGLIIGMSVNIINNTKNKLKADRYLAEKYDREKEEIEEKAKKYKEYEKEEKKMKEKSQGNTSGYSLEDENVKKIYKELKTGKAIEDVAKDFKIKKGEVYDIKIFLEDEGML